MSLSLLPIHSKMVMSMARPVTLLAYNRYNLFTPDFNTHFRGLEVVVDQDHENYTAVCEAVASINNPANVHMGDDIERITQLLADSTYSAQAFDHTPIHLVADPVEQDEVTE